MAHARGKFVVTMENRTAAWSGMSLNRLERKKRVVISLNVSEMIFSCLRPPKCKINIMYKQHSGIGPDWHLI